jgi:hypothetical protein
MRFYPGQRIGRHERERVAPGDKAGLKKSQKGRKWRRLSRTPSGVFSLGEEEPKNPKG